MALLQNLIGLFCLHRGKSAYGAYQTKLPVLEMEPCRTWQSHKADVLDIAWSSASELVLSASLDKTVRLWTVTQDACLREIPHNTWVTSVRFHPKEPSKFVSGASLLNCAFVVMNRHVLHHIIK